MFSQYLVLSYSLSVQIQINSRFTYHSAIFSFFLFLKRSNTNRLKDSHIIIRFFSNIRPQSRSLTPSLSRLSDRQFPCVRCRSVLVWRITSRPRVSVPPFLPQWTHTRTRTHHLDHTHITSPHDVTRSSHHGTDTARPSRSIRRNAARRDVLNRYAHGAGIHMRVRAKPIMNLLNYNNLCTFLQKRASNDFLNSFVLHMRVRVKQIINLLNFDIVCSSLLHKIRTRIFHCVVYIHSCEQYSICD